jgi:hypothetical protein
MVMVRMSYSIVRKVGLGLGLYMVIWLGLGSGSGFSDREG